MRAHYFFPSKQLTHQRCSVWLRIRLVDCFKRGSESESFVCKLFATQSERCKTPHEKIIDFQRWISIIYSSNRIQNILSGFFLLKLLLLSLSITLYSIRNEVKLHYIMQYCIKQIFVPNLFIYSIVFLHLKVFFWIVSSFLVPFCLCICLFCSFIIQRRHCLICFLHVRVSIHVWSK